MVIRLIADSSHPFATANRTDANIESITKSRNREITKYLRPFPRAFLITAVIFHEPPR